MNLIKGKYILAVYSSPAYDGALGASFEGSNAK
jgi:hypothetical protein